MARTIHDVKSEHEGDLLAMPGVVSVGLGQTPEGEPVIVVGLDRPRPVTMAQLPQTLGGYPVRIEVVGQIKAQEDTGKRGEA